MASQRHSLLSGNNVGSIVRWTVADSTERLALSPTAADLGRVCWQQDTDTLYFLAATDPTWVQMSSGSAAVTTVFGRSGDVVATAGDYDLSELGDVNLTGLADGYVLKWDAGNSEWVVAAESGGGGGSAIEVEDEGVSLTTGVTKFNFVGAGVTATEPSPDEITVTIPGGSGSGTVDVVSNVAQDRVLGRVSAGSGDSEELTAAQVRTLINVEDGATADQTGAEIKAAYEGEADTNAFTDAEKTKLSGIEASADVTDTANVTAAGALMDSEVNNLSGIKTLTVPDNTTISSFGATLVDDADAATARTTLDAARAMLSGAGAPGVSTGDGYPLGTVYADTTSDEGYILTDNTAGANVWSTATGSGAGASFSTITGVPEDNANISTFGASLIDDADAATARATLGLDEYSPAGITGNADFEVNGGPSVTDPSGLAIKGGASVGTGVKAGPLYLSGGVAAVGDADGGDVDLYGGAGVGTGANGDVRIGGFSFDGDGGSLTAQANEIYFFKGFTIADSGSAPVTKAAASGEAQVWVQTDGNIYYRYEDGSDEQLNTTGGGGGFADAPDAALFTDRADHVNAPATGFGELWLLDGTEQDFVFTDESGDDRHVVTRRDGDTWSANQIIRASSGNSAQTKSDADLTYTTGSLNVIATDPLITLGEHTSAPGTPSAGQVALYAKTDGLLYSKDDAGAETLVSGGAGGGGGSAKVAFSIQGATASAGGTADTWYVADDRVINSDALWTEDLGTGTDPVPTIFLPAWIMPFNGAVTEIALWIRSGASGNNGKFALYKWTPTDGSTTIGTVTQIGADMDIGSVVTAFNRTYDLSQTISSNNTVSKGDKLALFYRADSTSPSGPVNLSGTVLVEES
jgi:hypothetical protein